MFSLANVVYAFSTQVNMNNASLPHSSSFMFQLSDTLSKQDNFFANMHNSSPSGMLYSGTFGHSYQDDNRGRFLGRSRGRGRNGQN